MLDRGVTKFRTSPPAVSPHHLVKLKPQQPILKSVLSSISLLNRRICLRVR